MKQDILVSHQSKGSRIHECFLIHHIQCIGIRKVFTLQGNSDS